MLGYSCEELLSMPISAIHPDEIPKFRAFAKSVSEKGAGWTNELTCLTRPGVKLAAEISVSYRHFRQDLHDRTGSGHYRP